MAGVTREKVATMTEVAKAIEVKIKVTVRTIVLQVPVFNQELLAPE